MLKMVDLYCVVTMVRMGSSASTVVLVELLELGVSPGVSLGAGEGVG